MFISIPNLSFPVRDTISHPSRTSLSLCETQSVISFHSSHVALCSSPSRTTARTEIRRAGLRNPTPCIETPARVCGQLGFWGASSATARQRDSLLSLLRIGIVGEHSRLRLLRLLPGGRSRDCTANIYLHRLRSTTSSNTLCRLV